MLYSMYIYIYIYVCLWSTCEDSDCAPASWGRAAAMPRFGICFPDSYFAQCESDPRNLIPKVRSILEWRRTAMHHSTGARARRVAIRHTGKNVKRHLLGLFLRPLGKELQPNIFVNRLFKSIFR